MTHRTPLVTEDHGTGAHILTDPTPHFMSHFASDRKIESCVPGCVCTCLAYLKCILNHK